MQDLWPVSLLFSEGHVHHVSDGESGHGALSQGDDLVDAFHHGVQLAMGLQGELAADLWDKRGWRWSKESGDRTQVRPSRLYQSVMEIKGLSCLKVDLRNISEKKTKKDC